jgi:DDE_Tnp_1-associated
MPALSSSPVHPALGHLADLAGEVAGDSPGLLAVLARAADPRHRRGVRHRLAVILGLAVCAVLAGARSFTAIAEWAADADEQTLARLGVSTILRLAGPTSIAAVLRYHARRPSRPSRRP